MSVKRIILIGIAVVLAVFCVVVALQPSQYTVTRSINIAAAPSVIFPHVNDLKKNFEWSPWSKIDPDCKYTYDGPASGKDASYSWAGNSQVGAGKVVITETRPNELVRERLEFLKPFAGIASTDF